MLEIETGVCKRCGRNVLGGDVVACLDCNKSHAEDREIKTQDNG